MAGDGSRTVTALNQASDWLSATVRRDSRPYRLRSNRRESSCFCRRTLHLRPAIRRRSRAKRSLHGTKIRRSRH